MVAEADGNGDRRCCQDETSARGRLAWPRRFFDFAASVGFWPADHGRAGIINIRSFFDAAPGYFEKHSDVLIGAVSEEGMC